MDINDIIKDDLNIVKMGQKVFVMNEIPFTFKESLDLMKEYYGEIIQRHVEALNNEVYHKAEFDANEEFKAVLASRRTSQVSIPDAMKGIKVISLNGSLCPVRSVLFYPTCIKGRLNNYSSDMKCHVMDKYPEAKELFMKASRQAQLIITFTTAPMAVVNYALMLNKVMTDMHVFHAYSRSSDAWHELCTGEVEGKRFWDAPGFYDAVRAINIDSIATMAMQFQMPNKILTVTNLIANYEYSYSLLDEDGTTSTAEWTV